MSFLNTFNLIQYHSQSHSEEDEVPYFFHKYDWIHVFRANISSIKYLMLNLRVSQLIFLKRDSRELIR